jgi:hypothetical protein
MPTRPLPVVVAPVFDDEDDDDDAMAKFVGDDVLDDK